MASGMSRYPDEEMGDDLWGDDLWDGDEDDSEDDPEDDSDGENSKYDIDLHGADEYPDWIEDP
jgi:hypothetical protein